MPEAREWVAPDGEASATPQEVAWVPGVRLLDGRDRSWMDRAACVGVENGDAIFFSESSAGRPVAAKAICGRCPVREECLEYGLTENFGVWGGLSVRERRRLRRARRSGRAA